MKHKMGTNVNYVDDMKAASVMADIARIESADGRHIAADEFLCTLLVAQGYVQIVEEFKDMEKWYA